MQSIPGILLGSTELLQRTNLLLQAQSRDSFWLGGTTFNTDYRIDPDAKARIVWRWWPMGFVLSELYLIHIPSGEKIVVRYQ
jgi:hypothetical protein